MTNPVKVELGKFKYLEGEDEHHHVHGHLNFQIGGRSVPMMGFWGPDDVCFNTWIEEFVRFQNAVQSGESSYKFDEGEQGQPAYLFKILPQSVISLSIVDSEIGDGGNALEDWQDIPFDYVNFEAEFLKFKTDFLAKIEELAPEYIDFWKDIFDPN